MANVQEILDQIDNGIASYIPVITQLQEQYFSQNGRYWQGLFTHASPPSNDNTAAPDQLEQSPTDQDFSWNDIASGIIPEQMLSRIRIDSYKSAGGHGFVIIAEKIINGETYSKSYNMGPESGRATEWAVVSE